MEPIAARAEAVWDEQLDDADLHEAWRRQQRLVGLKPSWSKVSGPTGAIVMFLRQLGWTWPHHTTFVTASGHEVDLRQICPRDVKAQTTVDSELALWRQWADNDERKELLPCPLLEPVILANKRAHRRPQEVPAIKAALGVIQSGWWTQQVANEAGIAEHPFFLNCGPAVLGSSIVGMSSLPRNPHGPSSDSSAPGTDRAWRQTQVRERERPDGDARPC